MEWGVSPGPDHTRGQSVSAARWSLRLGRDDSGQYYPGVRPTRKYVTQCSKDHCPFAEVQPTRRPALSTQAMALALWELRGIAGYLGHVGGCRAGRQWPPPSRTTQPFL